MTYLVLVTLVMLAVWCTKQKPCFVIVLAHLGAEVLKMHETVFALHLGQILMDLSLGYLILTTLLRSLK